MPKTFKISVALAALTTLGGSAFAQTPPPAPPASAHHSFLKNLLHHNKPAPVKPMGGHMMPGHFDGSPGRPGMMGHTMMGHTMPGHMMGSTSPMSGGIIGNKNTHVFHMPGDKGALPSPQNRVYFHNAREAMAAGYHPAGGSHGTSPKMKGSPMHGSPMHGSPMHGMPMHTMPMHTMPMHTMPMHTMHPMPGTTH